MQDNELGEAGGPNPPAPVLRGRDAHKRNVELAKKIQASSRAARTQADADRYSVLSPVSHVAYSGLLTLPVYCRRYIMRFLDYAGESEFNPRILNKELPDNITGFLRKILHPADSTPRKVCVAVKSLMGYGSLI